MKTEIWIRMGTVHQHLLFIESHHQTRKKTITGHITGHFPKSYSCNVEAVTAFITWVLINGYCVSPLIVEWPSHFALIVAEFIDFADGKIIKVRQWNHIASSIERFHLPFVEYIDTVKEYCHVKTE